MDHTHTTVSLTGTEVEDLISSLGPFEIFEYSGHRVLDANGELFVLTRPQGRLTLESPWEFDLDPEEVYASLSQGGISTERYPS